MFTGRVILTSIYFSLGFLYTSAATVADGTETEGFSPTKINGFTPSTEGPPGMVWVPGGEFSMGCNGSGAEVCGFSSPINDTQPIHRVYVDGFWMDVTVVTNESFAKFVAATGYVTVAERPLKPEDYPGVPVENLTPSGLVFTPPDGPVPLDSPLRWWRVVPGANWQHPEGPQSTIANRQNYPVTQIAYDDAVSYANWAGKRLPTEAEWEFAGRGGQAGKRYPWGDSLTVEGKWMANIWQGHFPDKNDLADGYAGLSPVTAFPSNPYGLYDMAGNVWQWCADWYRPDYYLLQSKEGVVRKPVGPEASESYDPSEPGIAKRVQRGGSYLCTDQYCTRYMLGTRGKGSPDTGSDHVGFRCVLSALALK